MKIEIESDVLKDILDNLKEEIREIAQDYIRDNEHVSLSDLYRHINYEERVSWCVPVGNKNIREITYLYFYDFDLYTNISINPYGTFTMFMQDRISEYMVHQIGEYLEENLQNWIDDKKICDSIEP